MHRRAPLLLAPVVGSLLVLGGAQGGAFPGTNGLIAFTCGSTDVCTINPDGTGLRTLVTGATDPSWSGDGLKIAYVSGTGIVVANADGSGTRTVTGTVGTPTQPTFSDDGSRIAYTSGNDIHTIPAAGGTDQNVTNTATVNESDPVYSPDGTKVAFVSNSGGQTDIWTALVANPAQLVRVTNDADVESAPSWSPNGSTIAYSAGGQLYTISSGGGGTRTTLTGATGTQPSYSADGTKIAYITAATHLAVYNLSTSTGSDIRTVAGDLQPDWQKQPAASSGGGGTGAPANTAYPAINLPSGASAPTIGQFVTASLGTWTGDAFISYTYQWKRCQPGDRFNGECINISGATFSSYSPVSADFGFRLRVMVTAKNSKGSSSQNSEASAPVIAVAPTLRVTPQIQGSNVVDQTLTLSAGTWDGSPAPTFAYSWRRCNAAGDLATCVEIGGATASTYKLAVADIGSSIRVWITGSNQAGSAVAVTNHTFPTVDKQHFAPSTIMAPTIAGAVFVGRQLTAGTGSYSGDAPLDASKLVWQRCDATGGACFDIVSATKRVYYPTVDDVGSTLRIAVTVTNAYGTLVAQSNASEPIAAERPHRKGRVVVGTARGEYLAGGGFDDRISGLGGNDTLLGGSGDDLIDGGRGNDIITGGGGADRLLGGPGSDTIYAQDGERDIVDCGPGRDRAVVDSVDIVKNCEVVVLPAASPAPAPAPTPTPPPEPRRR